MKDVFLRWGALTLPTTLREERAWGETEDAKLPIKYIRNDIPLFEIPPYRGQSYQDRVPDTLDIAERMKLAIHALTSVTDPAADCEIYWIADFFRNPPVLMHDFNDWVQNQEGFMEALPLLRQATGESLNSQVDPCWMKSTLKSIGPDGLVYLPLEGRPWSRLNASGVDPVWRTDGTQTTFKDPSVTQAANASTCQRIIGTMTIYYVRDKNLMWKSTIEKMIERLSELTIDRALDPVAAGADYCYFPPGSFEPNAKIDRHAEMPTGSDWGVSWNTRLLGGMSQYCRVTGYEPPRDLAFKLFRYTRYHSDSFEPNGIWTLDPEIRGQKNWGGYNVEGLKVGGHAGQHGVALVAVIDYAATFNDREASNSSGRATSGHESQYRVSESPIWSVGFLSFTYLITKVARAIRLGTCWLSQSS
jgi:hypothetical protein